MTKNKPNFDQKKEQGKRETGDKKLDGPNRPSV